MKLISLFLSLCFSLNVMAASGSIQGLEQAFNEYHYAVTVEWDQKDNSFKEAQTNLFFAQIEKLIAEGLTKKEISNFVESKVSNQDALSNLQLQMNSLAKDANSAEELATMLNTHSADFYQQGASWESRVVVVGAVAAISALFVYSIFFNLKYGCVQTENGVKSYCTDDPTYNHF